MNDTLTRLFIFIDDFSKAFNSYTEIDPENEFLVPYLRQEIQDNCQLCLSEILTIIVYFHSSGFKAFKHYYKFLKRYHLKEFPNLISYSRFVEIKQNYTFELFIL